MAPVIMACKVLSKERDRLTAKQAMLRDRLTLLHETMAAIAPDGKRAAPEEGLCRHCRCPFHATAADKKCMLYDAYKTLESRTGSPPEHAAVIASAPPKTSEPTVGTPAAPKATSRRRARKRPPPSPSSESSTEEESDSDEDAE